MTDADDLMVKQMEERRKNLADRRTITTPVKEDRRKTCQFCFQRGDHPTPAHCLRALERP